MRWFWLGCLVLSFGCVARTAKAQGFEEEPIRYSESMPENPASRLLKRIESGETHWQHEPHFGYLRALLRELAIDESSQTLVFSKTSLQRHRISPETPRALYFNDDIYVGFCSGGDVLEVSAADPNLGAVFYTVEQQQASPPRMIRQTDNCLICHGSSQTKEVPGHLIRSVFVGSDGMPILSAGTYRTDHSSPLEQRWGGWYVTGTHGAQKHLGNLVIEGEAEPRKADNSAGQNLTTLGDRIQVSQYLSPHSDIVALMVLEHQADAHNLITRANFVTRQALHYQAMLNREMDEPADHVWDSTRSRLKSACEPLVAYLFFSGEAALSARIAGTSEFANRFAEQGVRDRQGRSLRDFDLETRLFKYPCSYLVYSPNFQSLPSVAKEYVLRRMKEILAGQDPSPKFSHLTAADRTAITEILRDTLPEFSG